MPTARHHISSAQVDGKILVVGGRVTEVSSSLDINQKYDPKNDSWVELEPMPTERSGVAAVTVDGNVYVMGGEKILGSFNKLEKYDPRSDSWTSEPQMPTSRLGLDAVNLNGKIYAIGGKTNQSSQSATDVNEIFVPN
jgi:N-acetylneuraminic acid mutarotase